MNTVDERIFDALRRRVAGETFGKTLCLEVVALNTGYAKVEATFPVSARNIFGTVHGGAIFSLIDEAFGCAANSHGTVAVALNVDVTYHSPAREGHRLTAEAREVHRSRKIGKYYITVTDEDDTLVATCQAIAFRKAEPLPFLDG